MNVALSSELLSFNLVSKGLEKSAVELYLRNFGIELYNYLEGQYQIDATNTANEFCPKCSIDYLKKTNLNLPYNSDTAHLDGTRTMLEKLALLKSSQSTAKKESSGKKVVDNARDTLIIDNCEPEQLPNVIYALTDNLISRFPCLIISADDSLALELSQRDTIIQLVNDFAIWHEQSESVYSDNPCLVSNKEQQQLLQGQLTPELLSIWQYDRKEQESSQFMNDLRTRVEALRQQNNNRTRSKGFVGLSLQELRQLV